MAITTSPDDTPATEAEANLGVREFRSELAADGVVLDQGLSLTHRPDAISLDYHTCYTLGPVHIGDFSAGPVDRPWRIRVIGNQVFIARLNDDRTDFEDDSLLFEFTGVAPTEIDAAFDQAARILVCMERPSGNENLSEIWIRYYDPFSSAYVVTNFGTGRTPRALLDDAFDSSNADILVFYLNDAVGMCYRQQRDRYVTEYVVTDTAPIAVDTSGMTLVGPVSFAYPGPPNVISGFLGYSSAVSGDITLRGAGTPGLVVPGTLQTAPASTEFTGIVDGSTPENVDPGYSFDVIFATPVNLIHIEMLNSQYDGAVVAAYDKNYTLLGSKVLTHTVAATPQLVELAFEGIVTLHLAAPATDTTRWRNLTYSTSPLPALPVDAWPPAARIYLEDVYKSTTNRVTVLYSVHDPVAGTWSLRTKSSVLYPFTTDIDTWQQKHTAPQSGEIDRILLYVMGSGDLNPAGGAPDAFIDREFWQLAVTPQSALLVSTVSVISHTLYDVDTWQLFTVTPQSGLLVVVIISHTLYDVDTWQLLTVTPVSGALVVVVIMHTLYDIDSWKVTAPIPQSGTLA